MQVIPQIDKFQENGYTKEEMKVATVAMAMIPLEMGHFNSETPQTSVSETRKSCQFTLKSIPWFVDFSSISVRMDERVLEAIFNHSQKHGRFQASFREIRPQVSDTISYARICQHVESHRHTIPRTINRIDRPPNPRVYHVFAFIPSIFHLFSIFSHCH